MGHAVYSVSDPRARILKSSVEKLSSEKHIHEEYALYSMLGIPIELYTPLFAVSRMAGWSAHRMEELINMGKIIRPAYFAVGPRRDYVPIEKR